MKMAAQCVWHSYRISAHKKKPMAGCVPVRAAIHSRYARLPTGRIACRKGLYGFFNFSSFPCGIKSASLVHILQNILPIVRSIS